MLHFCALSKIENAFSDKDFAGRLTELSEYLQLCINPVATLRIRMTLHLVYSAIDQYQWGFILSALRLRERYNLPEKSTFVP
jgi:hypothetical protein